jgi:hypothetical protein
VSWQSGPRQADRQREYVIIVLRRYTTPRYDTIRPDEAGRRMESNPLITALLKAASLLLPVLQHG